MNILKSIAITDNPNGGQVATIFFTDKKLTQSFNIVDNRVRVHAQKGVTKTEFINLECFNSGSLNGNSIILRFNDRWQNRPRELKLTLNEWDLIDQVAEFFEAAQGVGLQVQEHFAKFRMRENLKK